MPLVREVGGLVREIHHDAILEGESLALVNRDAPSQDQRQVPPLQSLHALVLGGARTCACPGDSSLTFSEGRARQRGRPALYTLTPDRPPLAALLI